MKKLYGIIFVVLCIVVLGLVTQDISSSPISKTPDLPIISIYPTIVYPGDPIFITVNASSSLTSLTLDGKNIKTISYNNKPLALIPVDFSERKSGYKISVKLSNGQIATTSITITPREKIERPLGIPTKLGGNTTAASQALVKNLAAENFSINNIKIIPNTLWTKSFVFPIATVFITDDYGYDRKTVGQSIVHKGTDFRATTGTEVMAMNSGKVALARKFTVYGNTIIVDHGAGLQTLYMHLSKINVKEGDEVEAGQVVGLSGETGYAEAPHLHISVKINKISVDPMTFLGFFK